jgi:hypothetical protein
MGLEELGLQTKATPVAIQLIQPQALKTVAVAVVEQVLLVRQVSRLVLVVVEVTEFNRLLQAARFTEPEAAEA